MNATNSVYVDDIKLCSILPQLPLSTDEYTVVIILSVLSIIGVIGNGLVIFVYFNKKDKLTSSVFILALAGTDFFTCFVIIPFTAYFIYVKSVLVYDVVCKLYMFLITFNVPLSAFLMVAIAVDRYLCICHPFLRLITRSRARCIIGLLTGFASLLGILSCISYSVYRRPSDFDVADPCRNSSTEFVYVKMCTFPGIYVSMKYLEYWQKIYSSFFLISLIIVLLLYIMIYHSVIQRRAVRRKQKAYNNVKSTSEKPNNHLTTKKVNCDEVTNTTQPHSLQVEMNENGISSRSVPTVDESCPLQHRRHNHKEHDRLANIKTAVMLFIVAIVFIISFFPSWLMALQAVGENTIIFYLYFIYNVTNPIIYAFMNPTFREDVKKICK